MTTTIQYGSETDDVFIHESLSQSPSDGLLGLPPSPPPPPPVPPMFNNNDNMINNYKISLPHQEVNLVINRANITEIQARSIPSMLMSGNNIWTRRILPNLRIKQTVFDQHFGDSTSLLSSRYRRASVSTSPIGGINDEGLLSFVLLDATSKMLYDVPMRHLLQLVKKDYDDDASIDHVIRAIDETHMKSEWLDAVTALNKQFDKRPEDKARVLAHQGSTHGLVLIEQFFVKLVRVPAYEFKLIYLKFREEAPTQLERMNKHINDLLECIQVILNNEQLPGILHLLCLLYNSIAGKTIPGLHFDSILSVLSTRTLKQSTTISHLLCQLFEEQYPALLNIFDNQILLKLKDLSSIKYIPIYVDIRLLYTRYKQLNNSLNKFEDELIFLPEHIKTTLNDLEILFTKLFDYEQQIKNGEKDLSNYFCLRDLSLETCLTTLGQFIDKLRLSHMQNLEQRRRNQLLPKQQQQRISQTPSRSLRNIPNSYCTDTNIFRDHLNVPLTPITSRQRCKINRISRDRFLSSRDIAYDEQQEQTIQNLLSNTAPPRKRGHSPTVKNVLTKRPFNILETCTKNKLQEETNDVFISTTPEDTTMDCSITESTIVPTPSAISVCENQSTYYVSTPMRHLADFSNDQLSPKTNKYEHTEKEVDKENKSSTQSTSELSDDIYPLSNFANRDIISPILLSDSVTLDEDIESQTHISESVNSTDQQTYKTPTSNYPRSLNSNKFSNNDTIDQEKTKTIMKRASSMKSLRSPPTTTNNVFSRNIQRCGVSRQLSNEKDTEDIQTFSPSALIQTTVNRRIPSNKPKNTIRKVPSITISPATQPLRAFQMSSTFTTNEASKLTRKSTCSSQNHRLTVQKTFASRTILTNVLPSSTLINNHKNN
ncbi:unnamed protein product [Adineta steineri]|uniref:FH2 domain-containing protein n=1 Tax=Adineta steineri TaxID=433720 RepID=A0A815HVM2_9BILA|nr:unnamed protein product [Adineta steineri]CAF1357611.1 unnamed protein product [Adineta steineri]